MGHAVVRLLCAGVLVLGSTLAAVGPASPAEAVPSMSFVTASTPSDVRLGREQTVRCPSGQRVLGGGAYTSGELGETHVERLSPETAADGDSFTAWGSVVMRPDGTVFRGSWFMVVYAICGSGPAGLEYVTAFSSTGTRVTQTTTARCPAGKRVIGAGGMVDFAFGHVHIDEITPSADLGSVRVSAYRGAVAPPFPWRVRAFAICADPLPGLVRVGAPSPFDSLDKSVVVRCPAGTKVHSTGHDLTAVAGRASVAALYPSQPLDHVRLVVGEHTPGTIDMWQASAYAICAA